MIIACSYICYIASSLGGRGETCCLGGYPPFPTPLYETLPFIKSMHNLQALVTPLHVCMWIFLTYTMYQKLYQSGQTHPSVYWWCNASSTAEGPVRSWFSRLYIYIHIRGGYRISGKGSKHYTRATRVFYLQI